MTREKIEMATLVSIFLLALFAVADIEADEMVHQFKNPSFSGIGTSAHWLTIENQEFSRKMTIKEELKAIQEQIERDKENTTLARFIRNLESRIYAQLSRQLVENLFGETPSTSGILELEGNTIEYSIEDGIITLRIVDSDGNNCLHVCIDVFYKYILVLVIAAHTMCQCQNATNHGGEKAQKCVCTRYRQTVTINMALAFYRSSYSK